MILTIDGVASVICLKFEQPDWRQITMTAIVMAESAGDSLAVRPTKVTHGPAAVAPFVDTGEIYWHNVDRGLFQISDLWHPDCDNYTAFTPHLAWEYVGTYILPTNRWGWNFDAFNAYKSGAHMPWLRQARDAVNAYYPGHPDV